MLAIEPRWACSDPVRVARPCRLWVGFHMSIDVARRSSTASDRKIATLTGWLMVITFVTSIPAFFFLYAPVRDNPGLITGTGADPTASVALGAVLELVLIVASLGTAVVP